MLWPWMNNSDPRAYLLTWVYLICILVLVIGRRHWRSKCLCIQANNSLDRWLVRTFWLLVTSLFCSVVLSMFLWNFKNVQLWMLYSLCFATLFQAIAFAFLYSPVLFSRKGGRRTFLKTAIISQCIFVPPVGAIFGMMLWILKTTQNFFNYPRLPQ
jgi:hypothetical protein